MSWGVVFISLPNAGTLLCRTVFSHDRVLSRPVSPLFHWLCPRFSTFIDGAHGLCIVGIAPR